MRSISGHGSCSGQVRSGQAERTLDKTPPQSSTSLRRSTSPTWEVTSKRVTQQVF